MSATVDRPATDTAGRSWPSWSELVALLRSVGPPFLLALVVLIAVTTGIGLLIEHDVGASVRDLDGRVTDSLVLDRSPTLVDLTGVGVLFADVVTVTVLWIGAMVVGLVITRRWVVPMFFLVAIGGEKLTYLVSSLLVGRPRPAVEQIGNVFATTSFPSGHVGSAITLYGGIVVAVLWYRRTTHGGVSSMAVRIALGAGVAAIALAVAFSRVFRGQHHLSDVVWGAVLGTVWLFLGWWIVLRPAADDRRGSGALAS